jgi:hypothetical protein
MRNYINVIASAAKQSILSFCCAMDCFAALAMTVIQLNLAQSCLFAVLKKSRTCAGGGAPPLPLRERVGVRGHGLSIVRNPSPGSHLSMRSDLSHKGRGDIEHLGCVIARSEATKQSIFLFAAAMDCFALLAMTVC